MEHRWGERVELNIPVRLRLSPGYPAFGRLRDVSISGCRVEIPWSSLRRHSVDIEVVVPQGSAHRDAIHLQGCIVRETENGFGVEWEELSPPGLDFILKQTGPFNANVSALTSLAARP